MQISPAKVIPVFSKPLATFDRPSQSFADFLGDAEAQRGDDAAQASSFGAKGLFGAEVISPGTRPTPGPGRGPASNAPESGESPSGRTMLSASDGGVEPDPAAAAENVAGSAASSPDATAGGRFVSTVDLLPDVAGFQSDPGGFSTTATPVTAVEPNGAGEAPEGPEADIYLPPSGQKAAPEPQEAAVLVTGEGDVIDVHMASFAASEIDQAHLLRMASRAAADQGARIGDLRLNGERLIATNRGGIDGYSR